MILKQRPTNQASFTQKGATNPNDTSLLESRKPQRKLSQIHQRVTEESTQIRDTNKSQKRKDTHSKTKVDRRDTRETDLNVSMISGLEQETTQDVKMNELLAKSEGDPFLRRKLKTLMENDLKSLKRLNAKNTVTENQPNNNSMIWQRMTKKSVTLSPTQ